MVAGWWKQSELQIYSFLDLVEAHRVLDFVEENQRRANRAAAIEAAKRR